MTIDEPINKAMSALYQALKADYAKSVTLLGRKWYVRKTEPNTICSITFQGSIEPRHIYAAIEAYEQAKNMGDASTRKDEEELSSQNNSRFLSPANTALVRALLEAVERLDTGKYYNSLKIIANAYLERINHDK